MKRNNSLSEKIVDSVFRYEARRTRLIVARYITGFIILAVLIFISALAIWNILVEQQTFDLLQLFEEDWETVKDNIQEVLDTFLAEIPQGISALFFFFIALLILFFLSLKNNYSKIAKRLHSIREYFTKRR